MKVTFNRFSGASRWHFTPHSYFRYEGAEELAVGIELWLNEGAEPAFGVELLVQNMPTWFDEALDFVLRDRRRGHEKPAFTRRKEHTDA